MVAGTDVTINGATAGEYPVGHMALPVKDVGRLLLRCADRPGLVAAVSTFVADVGANIVSLDQHSTADRWNVRAAHHLSSAQFDRRPRRAGARLR